MKSTFAALAASALTVAALGFAGPANAEPTPSPDPEQTATGEDAMMMMTRAMYECMMGDRPGIPRAISNDRGVMFTCDRFSS
ncbi:hypothetical protein [Mycolicibacterium palauense]|uniref:hypothetical protein n=1 Tax=Mycolicibacterium palauense TaxID=2034511 RepID=UPI000BFEC9D4|nr:hypothetical protein [Mycolicibacterium palauense]